MRGIDRVKNLDNGWDKNGKYPRIDYVGSSFGRLTILKWEGRDKKVNTNMWLCECSCGTQTVVAQTHLRSGATQSCGCIRKEVMTLHGYSPYSQKRHALYNKFTYMKQRCYNENDTNYKDYGGRGIEMSKEWVNSPKEFIEWGLKNGYEEGLTIERIDNDGDYTPKNCCFITQTEQSNNTRATRRITYEGKTQNMKQWAKEVGINYGTLQGRIYRGWSVEDALFKPLGTKIIPRK